LAKDGDGGDFLQKAGQKKGEEWQVRIVALALAAKEKDISDFAAKDKEISDLTATKKKMEAASVKQAQLTSSHTYDDISDENSDDKVHEDLNRQLNAHSQLATISSP
jgi:hypothetical protein